MKNKKKISDIDKRTLALSILAFIILALVISLIAALFTYLTKTFVYPEISIRNLVSLFAGFSYILWPICEIYVMRTYVLPRIVKYFLIVHTAVSLFLMSYYYIYFTYFIVKGI